MAKKVNKKKKDIYIFLDNFRKKLGPIVKEIIEEILSESEGEIAKEIEKNPEKYGINKEELDYISKNGIPLYGVVEKVLIKFADEKVVFTPKARGISPYRIEERFGPMSERFFHTEFLTKEEIRKLRLKKAKPKSKKKPTSNKKIAPILSRKKCLELLDFYRKYLDNIGIKPLEVDDYSKSLNKKASLQHVRWFIDKTEKSIRSGGFAHQGERERIHRWIGFIQGELCRSGEFTMKELRDQTRP